MSAAAAEAGAEGLKEVEEQIMNRIYLAAANVALGNEVRKANNFVRDIRPNLNAVSACALEWAKAAKNLSDSRNRFTHSVDNLGVSWGGSAYDAFHNYAYNNAVATDKNSGVLQNVGQQLVSIYNQVAEHYNAAVKMVYETYGTMASVNFGQDGKEAVKQAAQLYAAHITERHVTVKGILQSGQSQLNGLTLALTQFTAPEYFPQAASGKSNWTHK